jgi:hypothetical protein
MKSTKEFLLRLVYVCEEEKEEFQKSSSDFVLACSDSPRYHHVARHQ